MIESGKKYLVSTDNWFYAPDGNCYRSAWGTCTLSSVEQVFEGFKPQRPSTNWFMRVGNGDSHVMIAGCQIHYAVRCDDRPIDSRENKNYVDKETGLEWCASRIYFADDVRA